MKLQFKGSGEIVYLDIDRKNKKLKVASSKTNYQIKDVPFNYLFDKGKESFQEKQTDTLNDEMFKKAIELEMAKVGYQLQNAKRGKDNQ